MRKPILRFIKNKTFILVTFLCINSFLLGFSSNFSFSRNISSSFSDAYNRTHLWSMRLADENYFQLARRIPCKEIEYFKGDQPEKINPCDKSSTNEFSLSNLIEAQKWIYEHQHPADCSNKRFAIIRQYAWSGFGSTVHQIAWALAIALSEDRIAVYQTPGNWVNFFKQKFVLIQCVF